MLSVYEKVNALDKRAIEVIVFKRRHFNGKRRYGFRKGGFTKRFFRR